jgi:hypothetical protein
LFTIVHAPRAAQYSQVNANGLRFMIFPSSKSGHVGARRSPDGALATRKHS